MMTENPRGQYRAELVRAVLDEDYVASQPHGEPMTPELWTVIDCRGDEHYGKDDDLPALVGYILADARLGGDRPVRWTLTGTPPVGGTLADAVADIGVTLHERWPSTWS